MNDGLGVAADVLLVVSLGGMLWSALSRVRRHRVRAVRCPACGRLTSRAYPRCPACGTPSEGS